MCSDFSEPAGGFGAAPADEHRRHLRNLGPVACQTVRIGLGRGEVSKLPRQIVRAA